MTIACYIQTNQFDEKIGGRILRRQRIALLRYCKRKGWKDVVVYSDKSNGLKLRRPGLDQLRREVRKGRVNLVLIAEWYRLGRSNTNLALILREFEKHGVPVTVPRGL
jgi:DNA invertase Pin-like site-specific DNA recombinase